MLGLSREEVYEFWAKDMPQHVFQPQIILWRANFINFDLLLIRTNEGQIKKKSLIRSKLILINMQNCIRRIGALEKQ